MNRRKLMQGVLTSSLTSGSFCGSSWARGGLQMGIVAPTSAFTKSLPQLMEEAEVPGFGASIVRNGHLVWQHFAGSANVATGQPIVSNSLFPAASLGKPVFSYGVLQLVGDGKFDLDSPLISYLEDDLPTGALAEKVTARHVLSHSTGFVNWRQHSDEKLTSSFEPGTKFQYSGEGFYLLQRCIEKVTGHGCEAWMQAKVLGPLGMKSSTYLWLFDAAQRLVQGYRQGKQQPFGEFAPVLYERIQQSTAPLQSWNHETITAAMMDKQHPNPPMPENMVPNVASSLLTTVADYGSFISRISAPEKDRFDLKPIIREAMMRPFVRINSALAWGLGWGIEQQGGLRYLWQWGDNGSWKNFTLIHPESRSGLVVFTNGANGLHIAERLLRVATAQDHAAFLWL